VVRFKLGTVNVTGNQHFSTSNILASMPGLVSGETPDTSSLGRSLAIANEHPTKRVELTMREGTQPDTIDAEVKVQDVKPQQMFAAFNNTGRRETGNYRASIGYQHSNLFDRDHVVTASYTTSPGYWDEVKQAGVNYVAPFYGLGGTVSAFYVRSDVNIAGTFGGLFDVSGRGEFFGARYTQEFPKRQEYGQKLSVGIDNKKFESSATLVGTAVPLPGVVDVGSRPLSVRYNGKWDALWGNFGFFVEYAHNLPGGSGNDNTAYALNDGGRGLATTNWNLWRFGTDLMYVFPANWRFNGRLRSQFANQPLISGEQFGLGGAYSVRGFLERETAGDDGYQVNLELWTPPILDNVRPLLFFDAGRRVIKAPVATQTGTDTLGSLGVGVRWNWRNHLDVSADFARVVAGLRNDITPNATPTGDYRVHFNLLYRF
jgi:hemolysin activation/secretion protein